MPQDESSLEAPVGERHALWLAIAATGVLSGALSFAFRFGLDEALELRQRLGAALEPLGVAGALALAGVCAAAAASAVWMTQRCAPEAAGSGIQHVEGVERGLLAMWPERVLGVKFAAGIVGIGGGLMLGREGPTMQMAASLALDPGVPVAPALFTTSGMAGLFAAVVRSPFTGTLLLVEMTGSNALALPLGIASLVGHFVAQGLGSKRIYESLLERELRARGCARRSA